MANINRPEDIDPKYLEIVKRHHELFTKGNLTTQERMEFERTGKVISEIEKASDEATAQKAQETKNKGVTKETIAAETQRLIDKRNKGSTAPQSAQQLQDTIDSIISPRSQGITEGISGEPLGDSLQDNLWMSEEKINTLNPIEPPVQSAANILVNKTSKKRPKNKRNTKKSRSPSEWMSEEEINNLNPTKASPDWMSEDEINALDPTELKHRPEMTQREVNEISPQMSEHETDALLDKGSGTWALEATTQPRLVEIRDAILALGGDGSSISPGASGSKEEKRKKKKDREDLFGESLDVLSQDPISPAGGAGSGSNIAKFLKGMKSPFKRLGRAWNKSRRSMPGKGKGTPTSKTGGGPALPKKPPIPTGSTKAAATGAAEATGGAEAAAGAGAAGAEVGGAAAMGPAVGAVVLLGLASIEAGKQVYAFARAQEQEIRKLAEVGPQQAAAIARLDAQRVGRDIKTAQETGDTSEKVTESISRLEDKLQPIESAITNIANILATNLVNLLTQVLEAANPIIDALTYIAKLLGGKEAPKQETPWQSLNNLQEQKKIAELPKWPQGPIGNQPRMN